MMDTHKESKRGGNRLPNQTRRSRKPRRRFLINLGLFITGLVVLVAGCAIWVTITASKISDELNAATQLVSRLTDEISDDRPEDAEVTVDQIQSHTKAAKEAAGHPLWTLSSVVPGVGANFSAVSEVARSADDVANLGLVPLVKVFRSLDWESLVPSGSGTDLEPLKAASPNVKSAAYAVRLSAERLNRIDTSGLLPQVAEPLSDAKEQLQSVTGALDAASDASQIIPAMLGSEEPRQYLLMIQNNAETRASGGIPGALAVLNLDNAKLSLGAQSSAGALGVMDPTLALDPEQRTIYSGRLGKYMQDVNLTPDFPTAASIAQSMWEQKTGQRVDGVISIDPVALGYILDATGPVSISNPELLALASGGLPTELNGDNVVPTLLSDVYAKIEEPKLQDVYFAGVAQEIFSALSDGRGDATGLIEGMTRGTKEGRVLVWSDSTSEQQLIAKYSLSGSTSGPSVSPAQFGVYFNDGTGAKMDYYVKRTVQLVKQCARDGYEQTSVRITSSNNAPANAGLSLPEYVTGGGKFGVAPGSIQTNIVAYGPIQANIETAELDSARTDFAPYVHDNRPVGILAIRLAPGESQTVEFTFGKIVQHTEPKVAVTPTVQNVDDVILPTISAKCDSPT